MSVQKDCVLRYRAEGHLRFEVPAVLCRRSVAPRVAARLAAICGVYRVSFYTRQKKISIHFQETVCDFKQLLKQFSKLLTELENAGAFVVHPVTKNPTFAHRITTKISQHADKFTVTRWIKEKTISTKKSLLGQKPNALIKDPEKAIIGFLNDMLVIFLIRLHWEHITELWIPHPFKYRNQWLATFYMFFLLIRSRRPR